MSFGFSVGDFITVIQLANKIRQEFVDAPSQFKAISDEVRSLLIVLANVEVVLSDRELRSEQVLELKQIADGCSSVLSQLEHTLDEYDELKSGHESDKREKRVWKRLKWEPEDIKQLRSGISTNIGLLNAFTSRLARENMTTLLRGQEYQEAADNFAVEPSRVKVKIYSKKLGGFHEVEAILDGGTSDNWITKALADSLGIDVKATPATAYATFNGGTFISKDSVKVTWFADGPRFKTHETVFRLAPGRVSFDLLLGSNILGSNLLAFDKTSAVLAKEKASEEEQIAVGLKGSQADANATRQDESDLQKREGDKAVIVPAPSRPWEYQEYQPHVTVDAVLEKLEGPNSQQWFKIEYENGKQENVSLDKLLRLRNGSDALDIYEDKGEDSGESDKPTMTSASISHNDRDSNSKLASQDDLRQDYPLEPPSMDSGYVSGGPLSTPEISRNRPLLAPDWKMAEPMLEEIAEDDSNEANEEDDTRSNLSVDSLGGSSLSSHVSFFDQDVKAAAQALILEILEQDETLNALFQESLEKIEPQRVRKNLAGFLQGYCRLLTQAGPTVDQQKGITFLKHRCMSFADAICTDFNPANIEAWKVWVAQRSKGQRDIRAAHLSRWLSGDFAASPTQAFERGDDGENENDEDSISSDELPPVIEELKDFMVRGEPMDLFREHFRRFVAGESIKEWKELTKRRAITSKLSDREERLIYAPIRSPKLEVKAKPTDHSIVELPEEKGFRISWRCRCNRKFESVIPGTDYEVAEAYKRKMDWNVRRDGPMIQNYLSERMENVIWAAAPRLLGLFSFEMKPSPIDSPDLEGGPGNGELPAQIIAGSMSEQRAAPDLSISSSTHTLQSNHMSERLYACIYQPKDHAWELGHTKVIRQTSPAMTGNLASNTQGHAGTNTQNSPENMDKKLFMALRAKLLKRKRRLTSHQGANHGQDSGRRALSRLWWWWWWWWNLRDISWKMWDCSCGRLSPVAISSLELWEFNLTPAPKLVDRVEKDKLPQEQNESRQESAGVSSVGVFSDEWEYSSLTGQELAEFKSLIGGRYIFHLLKHPEEAKPSSPIWAGLPKKIRSKLVNDGVSPKPGWGFQVEYEWNSAAFVILTSPFIVLVFIIAIILCVKFKWSLAAGVTLSLAPVTIFGYINVMIGGVTKQHGLSK